MKNPFSRFNTARIIIASVVTCFVLFPHGAFSQVEKLPRFVIEGPEEAGIGFFDYFEDVNELITIDIRGISVWDIESGGLLQFYQMEKFGGYAVESVSLSKSGRYMAVGCGNNRMFVYDRDRDEIVFEHRIPPIPGPESVWGWFSKQESILVITYGLGHMEVWDVLKNQQLFTDYRSRGGRTRHVDFYGNGDWFLVYDTVYSIMMERPVFQVDTVGARLVNQDRHLVGIRQVWEPTGSRQVVRYDALTGEVLEEYEPFFRESGKIMRFSTDGNYLIEAPSQSTSSDDESGPIEILGIADRRPVRSITNAARESFLISDAKFFHGGRTLAIASGPRLYIYDTSDLITDVADSQMHGD